MGNFWEIRFWNNSVLDWSIALGIIIIAIFTLMIFRKIVIRSLHNWSATTITTADDFLIVILEKSVLPLLYVGSIYLALTYLHLSDRFTKVINIAILFVATFYVLRIITAVVKHFVFSSISKNNDTEVKQKQAQGLILIINAVIWVLGFVFLIDNLGYDVTTIVAGLGIGGIAIALAAQTVLGDLFSYFVIFFDRPFEIGDFIVVDDKMGTVEYIGLKTTRLKTLSGEQLICSNKDLTDARVHNFKRMEKRRVVFKLGIVYQSTGEMLEKIPGLVKEIIEKQEGVQFDRGHFSGFGNFSLDFEFVYYVNGGDYNVYMDKQQAIYLDIFKTFEKEKIEFAYPTQTLFVANQNQNGSVASGNIVEEISSY